MGGLGYIGLNGMYQSSLNALGNQQMMLANIGTATNTSTSYLSGYNGGDPLAQQNQLANLLADVSTPLPKVKRQPKGIVLALASEIDDWHGDVLERLAA